LARERTIRGAVEQIKALSSEGVNVEVREVEAIPLSAAGKHRFTRSDVSPSGVQGFRCSGAPADKGGPDFDFAGPEHLNT